MSYYEDVQRLEGRSVRIIAQWVADILKPSNAIDVGCGPGHLMEELYALGIEVHGVDISEAAEEIVTRKGLPFTRLDLTGEQDLPGVPWDLVICCEVAEHLGAEDAETLVEKLARAGNTIFLTAAEPNSGQGGGILHLNERPNAYWLELFRDRGFDLDVALTENTRRHLRNEGVIAYLAAPMIIRRE